MTSRSLLYTLAALPCLAIASSATVAETVTYKYDALGRLSKSCILVGPAALQGRSVDVAFDKADNRSNLKSNIWAFRLNAGQQLTSPNSQYALTMQSGGNLVLTGPSGTMWSSGTSSAGSYVQLQTDGNLVVYSSANAPLWASNTAGYDCARLQVQNDGNVVIVAAGETPVWATGTAS